MNTLWLDCETYSELDLKLVGMYAYAEASEILMIGYALDDGPAAVWDVASGDAMPVALMTAIRSTCTVKAHNAMFDRNALRLGNLGIDIPIDRWQCTAVQALEHALPQSLDSCGEALGLSQDKAKSRAGKQLIKLFCGPQKHGSRYTQITHPAQWAQFTEYCRQDIVAMREISAKMPSWNYPDSRRERSVYALDQRINDRGIAIDTPFVNGAISAIAQSQELLVAELVAATKGSVQTAGQHEKLLAYVNALIDTPMQDMTAPTVADALMRSDLAPKARRLLEIRQQASRTGSSKYITVKRMTMRDGRIRGVLQIAGAGRTRRWAGRGFQPQNLSRLPRFLKNLYCDAVASVTNGSVPLIFDDVIGLCASLVRGAIVAPPGYRLEIADLSNIEGRMLAWLASEKWKIKAFADFDTGIGTDLYVLEYAKTFGVPVETVLADEKAGGTMRLVGKILSLSLQYGGSLRAFAKFAKLYGVCIVFEGEARPTDESKYAAVLTESEVYGVVKRWREANKKVVKFWYDLEAACVEAIECRAAVICGKLKMYCDGEWLRIKLPSGGHLCYFMPETCGKGFTYMGTNSLTRKWERIETYGGKLAENVTSAESRNFFAGSMLAIEAAGYSIAMHVHDEVVATVHDSDTDRNNALLCALLAAPQPAFPGLPVAATGHSDKRYSK